METPKEITSHKWDDPYYPHPSGQRFIFFDDEKPSKEDQEARKSAIIAEEEEAAMKNYPYFHKESGLYRDDPKCPAYSPTATTWIDPEIPAHHERMEARRKHIWLAGNAGSTVEYKGAHPRVMDYQVGGWYGRNQTDHREKIMANLVGLELSDESFLTKIREGLKGDMKSADIEKLWEKMSIYKAVRTALTKPCVNTKPRDKVKTTYRYEVHFEHRLAPGYDYGLHTEKIKWKIKVPTPKEANTEMAAWSKINKALNGHGDVSFMPRPPRRTLFLNPDGTSYLNEKRATGSPIQAKMAFARRHGYEAERVMVERVNFEKGSPTLKKHNLRGRQSLYVVSARKLSDESASTYYDPDPSYIEKVDADGDWVKSYQYAAGTLHKLNKETMILPSGSFVLSVRDLERAILAGANFADDDIDQFSDAFMDLEENGDDRLPAEGETPMRDIKALNEQEQMLHGALVDAGYFDHAEMLTVDYSRLPKDSTILEDIRATITNDFMPSLDNPRWLELEDTIFVKQLQAAKHAENPWDKAQFITDIILEKIGKYVCSLG